MTLTLASLKDALQQPFAVDTIRFLPKDIRQGEQGQYTCLALPYANKRVYEDRLNHLVFGEWSTPPTVPYAQANKLIIPVTVVILGVEHTDYGEAFLTLPGKNGSTREDENTATAAYSQAFRRACAKFLLGRYLYDLPKLTLPYNPRTRQVAVSRAERIAWVEKLYMQHGLQPRVYAVPQRPVISAAPEVQQSTPSSSPEAQQPILPVAPLVTPARSASAPEEKAAAAQLPALPSDHQSIPQPTCYPHDTFLDWVARQVERDAERVQGICTAYKVAELAQLSTRQREDLTQRLQRQATGQQGASSLSTAER